MKTNYIEPQIVVIELELENILCASVEDLTDNGSIGDF